MLLQMYQNAKKLISQGFSWETVLKSGCFPGTRKRDVGRLIEERRRFRLALSGAESPLPSPIAI